KDYVKLTPQEQEKLKATSRTEAEYQELSQQLQTEKEKNKILAEKLNDLPSPIVELGKGKEEMPSIVGDQIIKSIEESLNSALNPLQLEIAELKNQLINNPLSESSSINSSSKLPTDYQEI